MTDGDLSCHTGKGIPKMSLYTYLRERVSEHPDRTVRDKARILTFGELFQQAEEIGRTLTGRLYGILCRSDLDTARLLLACMATGKTAVPLSTRYGEAHVKRIQQAAGLSCILTEKGALTVGKPMTDEETLEGIRLILYTSGTTGIPKGAMLTDAGLLVNLLAVEGYFHIPGPIRIVRPLYHCAVLMGEFFLSLAKGVDIVFDGGEFHPVRLLDAIQTEKTAVLCATPTLFYQLCGAAIRRGRVLPLKSAAVSGECLTPGIAARMRQAMPETAIYHVYGLTEAGPRVSYLPPSLFDQIPDSVGVPLPCWEYTVVEGELLLRGESQMKGYYRSPEETERVLKNGWLHTGDVAEIDADGRLYIRSRRDDLIIRAGINIYPQEIENALRMESGIVDVMAFGKPDKTAGQRIYLKAVAPGLTKKDLWEICRKRLSPYQYPDDFELVETLPRNASGKLLRERSR